MASAIEAAKRLDEHQAARDQILPELSGWLGEVPPLIVPGGRHPDTIIQANQGAVNQVLLQVVQRLIGEVDALKAELGSLQAAAPAKRR